MRSVLDPYVIDEVDKAYNGGTVRLLDARPLGKGFGVRLPSGMTHWFDDEDKARASNYWSRDSVCLHIVITSHASFLSFETSDGRKGTEPYVHEYISTKEGLIDCDCGDCGTFTMAVARVLRELGLTKTNKCQASWDKDNWHSAGNRGYTIEYIDGHGSLIKF
jgi:hypothetical protein